MTAAMTDNQGKATVTQLPSKPPPRRRKPKTPVKRADPVPKVTIPDSQERQAAAALASLEAAESKRPSGSRWTVRREAELPERLARKPRRSKAQVVQDAEHEFDLDDALKDMNTDYIQCRDFGHSWRPHTARWVQASNAYESQLKCTRCTTVRTRWLSRTGAQLSGQYDYADGYLVKGMGRLTGADRDKVRLRSILAVIKPEG